MVEIKYRGIIAREKEIAFVKGFIANNPSLCRTALSKKLCEVWNWRQANGALRYMVCRGFLLTLERTGHIKLPPRRRAPRDIKKKTPVKIEVDQTPIYANLSEIKPLTIKQVGFKISLSIPLNTPFRAKGIAEGALFVAFAVIKDRSL